MFCTVHLNASILSIFLHLNVSKFGIKLYIVFIFLFPLSKINAHKATAQCQKGVIDEIAINTYVSLALDLSYEQLLGWNSGPDIIFFLRETVSTSN